MTDRFWPCPCPHGALVYCRDCIAIERDPVRREVAEALAVLAMPIAKSSMLGRRIYGGEKLRTEMCPEHKGQWCGLPFDPTPCGCDLTGWLRAE